MWQLLFFETLFLIFGPVNCTPQKLYFFKGIMAMRPNSFKPLLNRVHANHQRR